MGKEKVVLDTNILISALGWNGKPREIFLKVLNEDLTLVISQKQLEELKEVMNYPKFSFTEEEKDKFLTILQEIALMVETIGGLKVIKEDPDDDVILETAVIGKATIIVSGDDHLLQLKEYAGIKIVTVAKFLDPSI